MWYLMIALTICCVLVLYFLKLNRGQEKLLIAYQYKFIPDSLSDYVTVHSLKIR
ncbi:hypothetical protein SlGVgp043 [Spodoptera litura granulovirus]|uniref:Pif-7 n=1 Tax=Spodoptera litura granulovirus TaxID=359919 RepID=A5IZP5_9BBAC|nr:hypothetical protein SlGVgp043 [Spodoptera litura granulovirus]ABQ51986.1 hypothetical protein SlGVgp043 [Spodoptera litura granulovirus]